MTRTGLLLKEIKDFWRPSMVLSLLLYPQDIVSSKSLTDEDAELNNRKALYHRIENAIMEMGTFSFHASVSLLAEECRDSHKP